MGKRFPRFRRFAHQMVEVTRRFCAVCCCCGMIREEFERDTVSLASVLSDSVGGGGTFIPRSDEVGPCCQPRLSEQERRYLESVRGEPPNSSLLLSQEISPNISQISRFFMGSSDDAVLSLASRTQGSKTQVNDNETHLRRENTVDVIEIPDVNNLTLMSSLTDIDKTRNGNLGISDAVVDAIPKEDSHRTELLHCVYDSRSSFQSQTGLMKITRTFSPFSGLDNFRHLTDISLPGEMKTDLSTINHSPVLLNHQSGNWINESKCSISEYELAREGSSSCTSTERYQLCATSSSDVSFLSAKSAASKSESFVCDVEYASDKVWRTVLPEHWTTEETISLSQSSLIELVYLKNFRQKLAVKEVATKTSQTEALLLAECQSSFVSRLRAILVQGEVRYLCMAYYEKRDLAQWLDKDKNRQYFGESEAICIAAYLLVALDFLHNKGILHLAVKPSNILIQDTGYPILCDFSSAWKMDGSIDFSAGRSSRSIYTCPELRSSTCTKPCKSADFWSVGYIVYEVITGSGPTADTGTTAGSNTEIAGMWTDLDVRMMSIETQDYLLNQLNPDPSKRLGFESGARELMRHRAFLLTNWDDVRFGHRQERCELLGILEEIQEDELKRNCRLRDRFSESELGLAGMDSDGSDECGSSTSSSSDYDSLAYLQSILDWSSSEEESEGSNRPPLNRSLYPIPEDEEGCEGVP